MSRHKIALNSQDPEPSIDECSIPVWIKAGVTFFALGAASAFVLALSSPQEIILGLPIHLIIGISLAVAVLLILAAVLLWRAPGSAFALLSYWVIRALREFICTFASLGVVYLLTIRMPLASLRGGISLISLTILFMMGLFVPPISTIRFPLSWMRRVSVSLSKLVDRINAVPNWILCILVALLPVLIVCGVIYLGLGSHLSAYRPYSFWNDETGYWLWIRSFSQAGFDVGYNSPNELIARAPFNHYGEGSPLYIYIYGGIAQLIGWTPHLPILINFVILTLTIFLFMYFTKLEPVQIIITGLIVVLTWPILLYLPMTTQETLNQAIGFILAIIFFVLLTQREKTTLLARIAFVLFVYFATLLRLSWGLMLIPAIFYSLNGKLFQRIGISILLALGLYISAIWVTSYLVPPANNSIMSMIQASIVNGPRVIVDYIGFQFHQMFRFKKLTPNIAVMFQIAIIIGWNAIRILRSVKARHSAIAILESRSVFDVYAAASLAFAGLLFYIEEGFYRTFAPSLLIIYLLQAAKKDYRLLSTLLAINLVFFHAYMTFYAHVGDFQIVKADYTTKIPELEELQPEFEELVRFDPTARNAWCNTMLIPLDYYDRRLIIVPPGIGISYILDLNSIQTPVKSKYLLFDQKSYESLADGLHSQLLRSTSIGDLYYNIDSGCEHNP